MSRDELIDALHEQTRNAASLLALNGHALDGDDRALLFNLFSPLVTDLATARRELDEARAERDEWAGVARTRDRQLQAAEARLSEALAVLRAKLSSAERALDALRAERFDPERNEITLWGVRYSCDLFQHLGVAPVGALVRIEKRDGEVLTLRLLAPESSPSGTPHRCGPDCAGEDHASFTPPEGQGA